MKKIASLTVIATTIAATAAVAQVATQPSTPTTAPPAASSLPPAATSTLSTPQWYQPSGEELRSSKLVGSNVKNAAGENIGEINEIVLARDGGVAAIIGVGGFLGIGQQEVAVQFKSLSINKQPDGSLIVTVNATKDSLKSAPVWTYSSS